MKLSEVKSALIGLEGMGFKLPNGEMVPAHFHVTEIGKIAKHFIDCGGTVREEQVVNFQLWNANDYDHRLHPEKLLNIVELAEKTLNLGNWDIEVEYQAETIGKFALDFDGHNFLLVSTQTDCLAKDQCGITSAALKPKLSLSSLSKSQACEPGSGCC